MQKLQLCSGREDTDLIDRITFDYFYGQEADMLSFYRIPKLLFINDFFKVLSTDAKVLYGLMLDRMSYLLKISGLMREAGLISTFPLRIRWRC
jgi:hypothetical protein